MQPIQFIERGRVVPLSELEPDPGNPRGPVGSVDELTRSFQRVGQLVALIVSPHPEGPEGHRWIVRAGHRRLAAGIFADLPTMTVDVVPLQTPRAAIVAAENVARAGLSLLQEVRVVEEAVEALTFRGMAPTPPEVARELGLSEAWVRRRVRLSALTERARALLERMTVDAAHALATFAPTVQDRVVEALERHLGEGVTLDRAAVVSASSRARRALDRAPFRLDLVYAGGNDRRCDACEYRSDVQVDLFATAEAGAYCLDADCYDLRARVAYDVELEAQQAAGGLVSDSAEPWQNPYGSELVRVDSTAWAAGVGYAENQATWRDLVGGDLSKLGALTLLRDPSTGAAAWGCDRKRAEKVLGAVVKKREAAKAGDGDASATKRAEHAKAAELRAEGWRAVHAFGEAVTKKARELVEIECFGEASPAVLLGWLRAFGTALHALDEWQGVELATMPTDNAWRWLAVSAVEHVGTDLFDVRPLVEGVATPEGYGERGAELRRLAIEILGTEGHFKLFALALEHARAEVPRFDELVRVNLARASEPAPEAAGAPE